MIVTGFTDSKLNEVKTYDDSNLYQVGVNGVTQVVYDGTSLSYVEYTLNSINYTTSVLNPLFENSELFYKTETVYFFEASGLTEQNINVLKREAEMGISFPPKIESQIFIERQSISVFERHLRMEEIYTVEQIGEYKNGYYNIFNIE